MTVNLPDGQSRGFVCELFEIGHFQLPSLGPLGSNGLADARHFKVLREEDVVLCYVVLCFVILCYEFNG